MSRPDRGRHTSSLPAPASASAAAAAPAAAGWVACEATSDPRPRGRGGAGRAARRLLPTDDPAPARRRKARGGGRRSRRAPIDVRLCCGERPSGLTQAQVRDGQWSERYDQRLRRSRAPGRGRTGRFRNPLGRRGFAASRAGKSEDGVSAGVLPARAGRRGDGWTTLADDAVTGIVAKSSTGLPWVQPGLQPGQPRQVHESRPAWDGRVVASIDGRRERPGAR